MFATVSALFASVCEWGAFLWFVRHVKYEWAINSGARTRGNSNQRRNLCVAFLEGIQYSMMFYSRYC